jgi:phosphatidylinositol alpha-1,6-mannosyltransferase
MRRHLLVTNDFPPKVGGIQSYLWELWSRLDPTTFSVLTASSDERAQSFDAEQRERGIDITRVPGKILFFPSRANRQVVEERCEAVGADLVIYDPLVPLGLLAGRSSVRSAQILHGAEVAIPGRLPLARTAVRRALRASSGVIAAGPYPETEARRAAGTDQFPDVLQIPPGVDCERFVPLDPAERVAVRSRLGLPVDGPLVVSVSRLVPRKGMDTLIEAAGILAPSLPDLTVAIGGTGRDASRLAKLAERRRAPVRMLGRVADDDLPVLIAAADVFVMACRTRWAGLEQEGFGIVFLEAAAAGVPQVAGRSGGSHDAVVDGETGLILERPSDPRELAVSIERLVSDPARRAAMGLAGRERALASFDYGVLARRLGDALAGGWPDIEGKR